MDITLPDHALFYLPRVFQSYLANYRLSSAVLSFSELTGYCERPLLVICETSIPWLNPHLSYQVFSDVCAYIVTYTANPI